MSCLISLEAANKALIQLNRLPYSDVSDLLDELTFAIKNKIKFT